MFESYNSFQSKLQAQGRKKILRAEMYIITRNVNFKAKKLFICVKSDTMNCASD